MAAIHKLQKLGRNSSGDSAGVVLPKDDLRLDGCIQDGELVEQPEFSVTRVGPGEYRIKRLDGGEVDSAGD